MPFFTILTYILQILIDYDKVDKKKQDDDYIDLIIIITNELCSPSQLGCLRVVFLDRKISLFNNNTKICIYFPTIKKQQK